MSTPSQPDDSNVERGAVPPPWKRAENAAATGLTAGEMAKAAGALKGQRAGGPPPRGVVSGSTPRPETDPGEQAAPKPAAGPASGPIPVSKPASGPMPAANPQSGPNPQSGQNPPTGPNPATGPNPVAAPRPASGPASGPMPVAKPSASDSSGRPAPTPPGSGQRGPAGQGPGQPGPAKPNPAAPGASAPSAGPAPFVESATRNIPREDLAPKDELPDLDSIHHAEHAKEEAIARASSQTIPARAVGVPLRASVQVRRVDPWSVFKVAGVLSVTGFLIWMIAVAILYGVLGGMGIWDQINSSFGTIVNGDGSTSGQDLISGGQVFMFSALFGVVSAVLVTALTTISAYIYNVFADMVGGVEVTLADLD
ncbi:MAG: DUF3566 domain-containing protein [Gordonia sp. (in: high G+C Gram-positive bacteria)]|uniref:DUF3566 domain-containing protein n=1 Tax=Gordonia sp. (in: high G+C Gram-positive bacteria) TaxID=84139 RepID=UPI003C77F497